MAYHSHKWHDEGGIGKCKSTRISTITEKLKSLNRDMKNLKENVHSIKGRYESSDEIYYLPSEENSGEQEFLKKIGKEDRSPLESPAKETRTFSEKVKRCIHEEQENEEILLESLEKEPVNTPLVNTIRQTPDYIKCLQELMSEKIKIKEGLCAKEDKASYCAFGFDGSYDLIMKVVGYTYTIMEGLIPSMIDMSMEMEKLSSLEDTTVLGSFPPLPTQEESGTLFIPKGNEIDVVISVDSIRPISERFANTVMASYARVMVELRANMELKDNIDKEYQPVTKKPNASSSGNKKNGVVPIIEVSNSNPFDALNSVDNDREFGTDGWTTNLVNNEATSSRLRLLDNDRNPLVPAGIVKSDSELDVVFDETANLRILMSDKDGSDKASLRKTYSESLNNSFGIVSIALPTLSLFRDDPYMKVMHAYYAKESPIPPPVIMPPSPMISPMLDPQDFFLPKEILPPRKQAHFLSLSSTNLSAQPQASEIAENYHGAPDTSRARHKERIEDILNHLDELSLDHIKEMKGHVDGSPPIRYEESFSIQSMSSRTARKDHHHQATRLDPYHLQLSRIQPLDVCNCTENCKVKFATVKKMEDKFYNLVVKENDLKTYVRRFQELAVLCPNIEKLMEVFIGGLLRSIEGNVTASKPQTLEETINITQRIESKKPSELMLSTQLRTLGMLETFSCVEDVDYITQDLAVLCVKFATRWATRPSTTKTKEQPLETTKKSRIPIVKVRWNSKKGPEFTWEREDQIRAKYPHLFSNITPASN
uniref:Reverse transcriptase domain-containing protein n=1 Tax=Tanacetum cinerariifolium TaxID=118510 RepID=A0A699GQT1_TANCI|nr:reverse transcriptase domain-containing protein [Tanacetum cinerariifolium]